MGFDTDCNGGEHSDLGKRVDVGPRRSSRGRRFRHYDTLDLRDGLIVPAGEYVTTQRYISGLIAIVALVGSAVWYLAASINDGKYVAQREIASISARTSVLEAEQKAANESRSDSLLQLREISNTLTQIRIDLKGKADKP